MASHSRPSFSHLGPLEQRVLYALWARGDSTARELTRHGNLRVAHTTVLTTLVRLHKKQFLIRMPEGRAFRYKARFTLEEMQRNYAREALRLMGSAKALSYLVEVVIDHNTELLDQLDRIIEHKRHLHKPAGSTLVISNDARCGNEG